MDKQKTYWIIGIAAAVIIALLIIFGMSSRRAEDPSSGSQSEGITDSSPENSSDAGSQAHASGNQETQQNPAVSKADENLAQYQKLQDEIMRQMMEDMEIEPSGNAALDFLNGMIPHHESAIEMAEVYLEYGGGNPDLKQVAEDIISSQKEEITLMNELIRTITESGEKDEEKEEKYLNAYSQMMSGHEHMNHGQPSAQDIEQAFAEGMIMHHQMAVDMAKAILEYTDNEVVVQLAEDMIEIQEEEIQTMKDVLALYH